MATSVEPQAKKRYAEFDEFVDYHLQKTRSNIKWTDILTALAAIVTLVVSYLLIFVVLDHWVVDGGFGYTTRVLMLAGIVVAAVVWLAWKIVLPYSKNVTSLFAARTIEASAPELKSGLLNLVDLRRADREVSERILNSIEKQAAVSLSTIDVDQVVNRRPLLSISYAMLAVVVLACLYTVLSPKKIWPSVTRALFPTSDVSVATRTQFLSVKPGDTELLAGTRMDVTVDLQGEVPKRVTLFYTTDDRRYVDEPVELRRAEEEFPQFKGVVTGENGRGILQDLTYHIAAGDAKTKNYKVTVNQPPSATVDEVHYEYPSYMKFDSKTQPGGHIDAWQGTKIRITATANMPVRSAKILFFDSEDAAVESDEVAMVVTKGTTLNVDNNKAWVAKIRLDGTYPRFYRIQCKNAKGESDPEPTLYSIKIHPDKRPDVVLLDPTRDLEMPANGIVPLMIHASDPDFMLRYVTLKIEKEGQELIHPSAVIFDGLKKSISTTFDFDLKPLNLAGGETITYYIEARDNKQPVYNRRNTSPKLNITIVEPVSEEDVQEQLKQDKQHQQEKLEQLLQDRNQSNSESTENQEPNDDEAGLSPPKAKPKSDSRDQDAEKKDSKNADGNQNKGQGSQAKNSEPSESDALNNDGSDDGEAIRKIYEREKEKQQAESGEKQDDSKTDATEKGEKQKEQSDPGGEGSQPNESSDKEPDSKKKNQGASGGKAVKDKSKKPGDPSNGADSPPVTDPVSPKKDAGGEQKAGKKDGRKTNKIKKGKEKPAEDSKDAVKKKATGDETGTAKPGDPKADSTKAKNDIKRKENTKPTTRPSKNPDAAKKKQQDAGTSKNPNAVKPAPQSKKKGSDKKNPDQRPTDPKKTDAKKPSAKKDDQPNKGNDELKGKPKDQKSQKPQGGDGGKSKANDQGNSDGKKPGAGDSTKKPGKAEPSQNKTGQSGKSKGEGSKSQGGKKSEGKSSGKSKSGQKGSGKASDQSGGKAKKGGKPGGSGSNAKGATSQGGGGTTRGGKHDGRKFGGSGSSSPAPEGEKPNLEFSRKAADLVLKRIQGDLERGETDPELLKELGWTEEDMKRFADRLRQQLRKADKDQSPEGKARRRQFEEMLKGLDLKTKGSRRSDPGARKRSVDGIGPRRLPVPAEWREAWEAYTKSLAKGTNAKKGKAKKK